MTIECCEYEAYRYIRILYVYTSVPLASVELDVLPRAAELEELIPHSPRGIEVGWGIRSQVFAGLHHSFHALYRSDSKIFNPVQTSVNARVNMVSGSEEEQSYFRVSNAEIIRNVKRICRITSS